MQRTLRSKRLRTLLWLAADGKCQICGAPLDPDTWHADHITPWRITHRTNVCEMQALCSKCNLMKGSALNLNLERLRPGQREAMNVIESRIRGSETKTAIVLPTRYGKSDVIRLSCLSMKHDGIVAGGIVLSPGLVLRQQIVNPTKINEMVARYGIDPALARLARVGEPYDFEIFPNNEYIVSMTIEYATRAKDIFAQMVAKIVNDTGLPVVVFIDECHQTSNKKPRGELVALMVNAGAHVVLLTATPIRADGEIIPGFEVDELQREDARRYVVVDAGDGDHNRVDVYEGVRQLVSLKAHSETTFKQAWEESPPPLCHLNRETIDVSLSDLTSGESGWLSELSPSACRKFLDRATRHEAVIRNGVRLLLDDLSKWRRVRDDLSAMVFTGNDAAATKIDDEHAKEVQRIILEESKAYDLRLRCVIATMKTDNENDKGKQRIEEFANRRIGDVLIVKQMGSAGLDVPHVKTLLDLSNVRTVASCIQRYMRVATPYEGIRTGTVITLADALSEAIWHRSVIEEGGQIQSWHGSDFEFLESYIVEKGTGVDQIEMIIEGAEFNAFDDSHGLIGDPLKFDVVNALLDKLPLLKTHYTKAEIASGIAGLCLPLAAHPEPNVIEVDIAEQRQHVVRLTTSLANTAANYNADQAAWVKAKRKWYDAAKRAAKLELTVELQQITNLKTLRTMTAFLDQQLSNAANKQVTQN